MWSSIFVVGCEDFDVFEEIRVGILSVYVKWFSIKFSGCIGVGFEGL